MTTSPQRGLALVFALRRVLVTLSASILIGLLNSLTYLTTPAIVVVGRSIIVGLSAMLVFGILEQWPAKLPAIFSRWGIQVVGVAFVIPLVVLAIYLVNTPAGAPPFWRDEFRLNGFMLMTISALLVGPWIAVAAVFRRTEVAMRTQAMSFELERSELERKALDSRLRLLQAQVEPHFLFNTLANVRELVDSGSAQASKVLDSLIAYLRAAVPRLHDPVTTMGQEVVLVRSYLELMHMRMPDRLQFTMEVDKEAEALLCPPTTLLTLVENAVRHGIDPSEEGGRIDVRVRVEGGRCIAEVRDSGVGLGAASNGLGTGLAALRERLQLVFGNDAHLALSTIVPRGTSARIDFPAQASAA